MAVDKLVDSSKLNAALDYEASKIIAKGGGTAPLAFDFENEKGFGDYVDAIPSGGGGASATGSFTVASGYITSKEITHNLGTDRIFGILWVEPDENNQIVCPGGYDVIFAMFTSNQFVYDVFDTDTVLVCNYTSNATKTAVMPATLDPVLRMMKSAWSNQAASWTSQGQVINYVRTQNATANTLTIMTNSGNTYFLKHTYHWKVWALDSIGGGT